MAHKFTIKQKLGDEFDIQITNSGHIMCPDSNCIGKNICKHRFLASNSKHRAYYKRIAGIDIPSDEIKIISNLWKALPWYKRVFI